MKNQIHDDAIEAGLMGRLDRISNPYLERLEKFAALIRARAIRREISDRLSYRLGLYHGKQSILLYELIMDRVKTLVKQPIVAGSREEILLEGLSDIIYQAEKSEIEKIPI